MTVKDIDGICGPSTYPLDCVQQIVAMVFPSNRNERQSVESGVRQ